MARTKDPVADRSDQLAAFEQLADALGFELRHNAFAVGEHTDIGLFAGPLASPVMNFSLGPPGAIDADDDAAIEAIIEGWEALEPKDYKESFQRFANDSYLLIGAGGVGHVTAGDIEDNHEFEKILASYPVHTPRQVTVSNVRIVHLGGQRAAATYTVDENYTNGTSFHGNAVAVLAKLSAGWRIIIATDHLCSTTDDSGSGDSGDDHSDSDTEH